MTSRDQIRSAGGAALAARLRRISEQLDRDGTKVYASRNISFEQRWYGTLRQLILNGPMSVGQIAAAMGVTHVAISQTSQSLEKAGIVESVETSADKRRRSIGLTARGTDLVERLEPLWTAFNEAAAELNAEAGDVILLLDRLEDALARKSMFDRIIEHAQTGEIESG